MIPGLTTVNEEYNFMSIPSPWFGHSLFGSYLMDAQGLLQMYFDKAKPPTDTVQLETIASPSLSTRKSFYSYKHKYSPLDLEKAVRDVRSGRLGTRKASIVYGIPRSTLRNKVYRIESITDKDFMQDNSSNISFNKNSSEIDKVANSESTWAKNSFFHKLLNNSSLNIMKNSCGQSILSGSSTASGGTSEIRPQLNNSLPENNIFSNLFQCERSFISPDLLKIMNDLAVLAPSATLTENTSFTKIKKNENDLWKKSRPKRGQYRKYDKSALDEAVKCVRLGEMSVHKAGSVYGVPHSTLEYKVKERNLLKKRKLSSETRDKTREESEHLETENTNKTHCK